MTPHEALEHRALLINYLLGKVKLCDWHGVSDAANDLRELEAAHPHLLTLTMQAQRIV